MSLDRTLAIAALVAMVAGCGTPSNAPAVASASSEPGASSVAIAPSAASSVAPPSADVAAGPCVATPAAPLDLTRALGDDACQVHEGGARPAGLPEGVDVACEPREASVKSGGVVRLHVVLTNRGPKMVSVVLLSAKSGLGGLQLSGSASGLGHLGTARRAAPKPADEPAAGAAREEATSGFSVNAYDDHGREVAAPAGMIGLTGIGFGAPGGALEMGAAKVDLAPGASARATVAWRAQGFNAKPSKPGAGPEPLDPGRYRLDVRLPTLGPDAKVAASASVTVVP